MQKPVCCTLCPTKIHRPEIDRNILTHINEHLQAFHSINYDYIVFKHLKINTHGSIMEILYIIGKDSHLKHSTKCMSVKKQRQ